MSYKFDLDNIAIRLNSHVKNSDTFRITFSLPDKQGTVSKGSVIEREIYGSNSDNCLGIEAHHLLGLARVISTHSQTEEYNEELILRLNRGIEFRTGYLPTCEIHAQYLVGREGIARDDYELRGLFRRKIITDLTDILPTEWLVRENL
jgi:hypothetical protein